MPIRSQAQAKYELVHPETFDKARVLAALRGAGGMKALPRRKKPGKANPMVSEAVRRRK